MELGETSRSRFRENECFPPPTEIVLDPGLKVIEAQAEGCAARRFPRREEPFLALKGYITNTGKDRVDMSLSLSAVKY